MRALIPGPHALPVRPAAARLRLPAGAVAVAGSRSPDRGEKRNEVVLRDSAEVGPEVVRLHQFELLNDGLSLGGSRSGEAARDELLA